MKTRHLTVMFTDIKGFTSRTSNSSRKELQELLDLHDKLIGTIFEKFGGTVVKTIGDAFMVTFDSPTDALLCGMEIQKVLAKHNSDAEEYNRLEVRIAINSGEVTIKGNDVFGEPVNVAARLEGIADAGDIYFTESVYLAMNKSEIPTAEVGYRHFKGVPDEVKVYKVLSEGGKKGFFKKDKIVVREVRKRDWKKIIKWAGIAFILLIFISVVLQNRQMKEDQMIEPEERFVDPTDEFRDPDIMDEPRDIHKEGMSPEEEQMFLEKASRIADEARFAIEEGDKHRARELIENIHRINGELGGNPGIENEIHDIEIFFMERFER